MSSDKNNTPHKKAPAKGKPPSVRQGGCFFEFFLKQKNCEQYSDLKVKLLVERVIFPRKFRIYLN